MTQITRWNPEDPAAWAGGQSRTAWRNLAVSIPALLAGALLAGAGTLSLGRNLTPLPHPKEGARLVETGAYRLVRHPIYGGIVLLAYGWGLCARSWLPLGYATLVFIFLDLKSRREERWLIEKYSGYAGYRKRTRKLIPFIY